MRKRNISNIKLPLIAIFICLLSGCENDENLVRNLNPRKLQIEEALNIKINYTTAGKTRATLTSPLMYRVQDATPYYEFPKTLQAGFYNDAGILESILTTHYARYRENESIIFLKDSVKVYNIQKGDTLYCEELYWDRNRIGSEFYTEKPVKIRTKTQLLDGVGMEASQDFKSWHIINPTGILQVSGSYLQ